jgi:predicted small metal-binding protein
MRLSITCECGRVVSAETDDELVAEAQRHASEAHDMDIPREQILLLAGQPPAETTQWQ